MSPSLVAIVSTTMHGGGMVFYECNCGVARRSAKLLYYSANEIICPMYKQAIGTRTLTDS